MKDIDDVHIFPKQSKQFNHVFWNMSIIEDLPETIRDYQQWRLDQGLSKASQGDIVAKTLLQANPQIRKIFREKERSKKYGKKYLDCIKETKANKSAR